MEHLLKLQALEFFKNFLYNKKKRESYRMNKDSKVIPFKKNNTEIDLGSTVYEANKQLIKQTEKPLTHLELPVKIELMRDFFEKKVKQYAMLLCHEQRDYTVFNLNPESLVAPLTAANDVIDCCSNRGKILSIENTEDNFAIEIWLSIDEEPYCYYLFPYDEAVIECS